MPSHDVDAPPAGSTGSSGSVASAAPAARADATAPAPVTLLLALHMQNDVLHEDGKIRVGLTADDPRRAQVITAAQQLIDAARQAGHAVAWVRIAFAPDHSDVVANCPIFRNVIRLGACAEGSWGACFHAAFEPRPDEPVVTHRRINAFFDTDLQTQIDARGVARLIVFGVATNSVVEHTARHASDIGYDVVVARDACATSDAGLHEASLRNLEYVATVADQAAALAMLRAPGGAA